MANITNGEVDVPLVVGKRGALDAVLVRHEAVKKRITLNLYLGRMEETKKEAKREEVRDR